MNAACKWSILQVNVGAQRLDSKKLHVIKAKKLGSMVKLRLMWLINMCRIDVNFTINVADFGLSESVGTKDYFRQDKSANVKLPLKWLSPESMEDCIFSEKPDVVSLTYLLCTRFGEELFSGSVYVYRHEALYACTCSRSVCLLFIRCIQY